jgi:hypothetical protein
MNNVKNGKRWPPAIPMAKVERIKNKNPQYGGYIWGVYSQNMGSKNPDSKRLF